MKPFFLFLFNALLVSISSNLVAQEIYSMFHSENYNLSDKEEIPFINENGKVIFRLPMTHKPFNNLSLPYSNYSHIEDLYGLDLKYFLSPFFNDRCVTASMGKLYWIDENGKIVKSFGTQYEKVSPFFNDFAIGYKKIYRSFDLKKIYLDKDGKNIFGTKEFSWAAPFSEGLAAVRLMETGEWGWIDKNGEFLIKPKNIDEKQIQELHSFSDGFAKVKIRLDTTDKYQYETLFVDRKGEEILNVTKLFPNRKFIVGNFEEGLLTISMEREDDYRDVFYIDSKGEIVLKFEQVYTYSSMIKGMAFISKPSEKHKHFLPNNHLFDTTGDSITLNIPDSLILTKIIGIGAKYILTKTRNKNKDGLLYTLFSKETLKPIVVTQDKIVGYNENRILRFYEPLGIYTFTDLDSKILWQSNFEKVVVDDIEEALVYPKMIKNYKCHRPADLYEGLYKLVNLESLELKGAFISSINNQIQSLQKLRELKMNDLPSISSLSKVIADLPQLEYLEIIDCKELKNDVEYIVENSRSLKKVVLINYQLQEGFLKKIRRLKPKLNIDVKTIEEEYDMEVEPLPGDY